MRGPPTHDRGNGVLKNQLLLRVVLQQHRILVERADLSRQLHPTHQIYGDRALVLADRVEKSILNVLRRLDIHMADLLGLYSELSKYSSAQGLNLPRKRLSLCRLHPTGFDAFSTRPSLPAHRASANAKR